MIKDKKDMTINIDGPKDLIEYEILTGTIRVRSRPGIPVILKLNVKNNSPITDQKFTGEIDANNEINKTKIGNIARYISTLVDSTTFQVSDQWGLCKLAEDRVTRVRSKYSLCQCHESKVLHKS